MVEKSRPMKSGETGNYSQHVAAGERAHHRAGLEWMQRVEEVNEMTIPSHDALLVGPADRYEFGEMLRPHVLTRVLSFSRFRCAGLVSADMTSFGGHSVRNYGESALEMTGRNLQVVHFGGDSLSRGIVDGYRDAISGEEAERFGSLSVIGDSAQLADYVKKRSGQLDDFGYLLAPEGEFFGANASFHAVGLSQPEELDPGRKERLLEVLRRASFVGVRDEVGADFLEAEGIAVHRMPCPLTVLPQVCARQLRESRDSESLESIRHRFPNGWIAVETGSIDPSCGDAFGAALREVAEREGLGVVFFSASPDSLDGGARRWVDSFPEWLAAEFPSHDIWDIASMLLHARLYCGSSLDCRIVCMSGGVARINVPDGTTATRSYCELWEHDEVPVEFDGEESWTVALETALQVDFSLLQEHAKSLHADYFDALDAYCRETGMYSRVTRAGESVSPEPVSTAVHHLHDEWLQESPGFEGRKTRHPRTSRKGLRELIGRGLIPGSRSRQTV